MDDATLKTLDLAVDSLRYQLNQYSGIVQELLGKIQVANDRINELQLTNNCLLEQLNRRSGTCSNCEFHPGQPSSPGSEQFSQSSTSFSEKLWDTVYANPDQLLPYCQNINRMEPPEDRTY